MSGITTPNTTSTGSYHVNGSADVRHRGTASRLGNTFSYLYADEDEKLSFSNCNIADLLDSNEMNLNALTTDNNWSNTKMKDQVQTSNDADFKTKYAPASVVMDQDFSKRAYYFWIDNNSDQVYATYNTSGQWSQCAYKIQNSSGENFQPNDSSYLDAYTYKGKIVLVRYYYDSGSNQAKLNFKLLDPMDIDDDNQRWKYIEGQSAHAGNLDDSYYQISVDWVSQGQVIDMDTGEGTNKDYAVASLYSSDDSKFYTLICTLDNNGLPATSSSQNYLLDSIKARRGAMVRRTLAGNLQVIYCDSNKELYTKDMNTFDDLNSSSSWGNKTKVGSSSTSSDEGPAIFYIEGDDYSSTQSFLTDDGSKNLETVNRPVYSVAIYASGDSDNKASDLKIRGNYVGTTQLVSEFSVNQPENPSHWIPSIIMEAFPVPNENIVNASNNQNLVEIYYGTSLDKGFSTKAEWQMLFGVRSSISTTKGVGPAVDAQIKAGPNAAMTDSTKIIERHAESVITAAVQKNGLRVVSDKGAAHGATLPTLTETIAIYTDARDTVQNSSTAPLYSMLTPKMNSSAPLANNYKIYTATPGDIRSYTEANINANMEKRYRDLSSADQSRLTPGYGTNYLRDVIEPNAYDLNGHPYLTFTINTDGSGAPSYEEINSVESSFGMSLDDSLYVGVYAGEEFSVFGLGEAIGAQVQGGFEFSVNTVATESDTTSWGITSNFNLPADVEGAYSYTVFMYICKPNVLWANELELFGDVSNKDNLVTDPALPSKVFFYVPESTIVQRND